MAEIDNSFCPNKDCKDYGLRNRGNIRYRGKYGKNKTKDYEQNPEKFTRPAEIKASHILIKSAESDTGVMGAWSKLSC